MSQFATNHAEEGRRLEPLEDVAGTAVVLHVSPRQVWRLIASGELRTVRVGRRVRIHPDEIRRYLDGGP